MSKPSFAVGIQPSATVLDPKSMVYKHEGISVGEQNYVFRGNQMTDLQRLTDHKICDGNELWLSLSTRKPRIREDALEVFLHYRGADTSIDR